MERRKVYTISLKLLSLFGVVVVMAVMINSMFPVKQIESNEEEAAANNEPEVLEVALESLFSGKMMYVQWSGKSVAIVKRINPPEAFATGEPLNPEWRSVRADYFIFYNAVGVAQCPLYLFPDGERLKDTCTGILYDLSGKRIEGQGESLQIPPHYFVNDNKVVIGQWDSGK